MPSKSEDGNTIGNSSGKLHANHTPYDNFLHYALVQRICIMNPSFMYLVSSQEYVYTSMVLYRMFVIIFVITFSAIAN